MNRVLVLLAAAACSSLASAQPRITSLSSTSAAARAITPDGRVVVGYVLSGVSTHRAFRWTQDGGFVEIGSAAEWTDATAVTPDGSVVVGYSTDTTGWRWTQSTGMVPVSLAGHGAGHLDAVSDDGQTIGGYAFNNETFITDAFLYNTSTGFSFLPRPSELMSTFVHAMSGDASKAAGAGGNSGTSRATLWDPLTLNRNVGIPGYSTNILAMTSDGSALVGSIGGDAVDFSPYLWTAAGGGRQLAHPPGAFSAKFTTVNAAATLAAGTSGNPNTPFRALIWRPGMPVMDANVYLPTQGVDLTGWTLEQINGMTPDGRILVGGGSHQTPTGTHEEAFIINLPCGIADFNGDGDTGTDADIDAFFACLAGNCCTTCGSVDFNGDGDIGTDADIESFFRVLSGQPC